MNGIKRQGGMLEEREGRFGMAFVSVTQHTAPHASEIINAYLSSTGQATPHNLLVHS